MYIWRNFIAMRKILLFLLLFCTLTSKSQQVGSYDIVNPYAYGLMSGSYNATHFRYTLPSSLVGIPAFPFYTISDTVLNAANDTFYEVIPFHPHSLYTWVNVVGVTGTNTSCTVKCFVSGDTAKGVGFIQIGSTFTVSATNPNANVKFDNWDYTVLMWVFYGSQTQKSYWNSGLNIN